MASETLTIPRATQARPGWTRGLQLAVVALGLLAVGLSLLGIPARFAELLNTPYAPPTYRTFIASYVLALDLGLALIFFVAAGIIVRYRPNDPVTLLLALTLLALGATETDMTDALINPEYSASGDIWRWPVWSLRALAWTGALVLLYVFPDGRPTPRWTAVLVPIWAVLNLLWLLLPWLPFSTVYGETWNDTPLASLLFGLAWFGTGLYAQIYRYRRVSDPLQQQQTKWTVAGLMAAVFGGVFYYVAQTLRYDWEASAGFVETLYILGRPTLQLGMMALLPVCVGIAILRYRLWGIDVIINRTLVYGALTVAVAGFYVLIVGGLGSLVRPGGNLLISLVATGIIAVLFQPLRERLQRTVNRLMYGQRDDPYAVISRLGRRLKATLAPDAVLPTIVETVATALKLPYAAIALKHGDEYRIAADYPTRNHGRNANETLTETSDTTPVAHPPLHSVVLPLTYRGETVGDLRLAPRAPDEPLSSADRRLLDDLARQAGIAVHAVRLTADLQRATAELQGVRARLVSARGGAPPPAPRPARRPGARACGPHL